MTSALLPTAAEQKNAATSGLQLHTLRPCLPVTGAESGKQTSSESSAARPQLLLAVPPPWRRWCCPQAAPRARCTRGACNSEKRAQPPPVAHPSPCRDLETGALVASFKGNACARGCLARLGRSHFLAGAQGWLSVASSAPHPCLTPPQPRAAAARCTRGPGAASSPPCAASPPSRCVSLVVSSGFFSQQLRRASPPRLTRSPSLRLSQRPARATTDIPLPCPGLLCNLCSCARCSALALMAEHTHVRLVSSDGFVFVIDARAARVSKTLDNMLSAQSACARLARSRRRVQCSRLLRRVCGGAAGRGHTARGACHVLSLGAALSSAVADTVCRVPQWCWCRCGATSTTG